ncbi:hypothetical protein UCRPC4_g02675 [Phaeomoniella chlamydospora]|uniref:DUF7905 domain-containing protein n=1 Tax=Phaeomoniella chlamydospora TaxID=158046 RepID=A0A0G2EM83_PHACM|nr:hypothetical protein UCRPC4_g02675 [Phaeomoniella chlamydospora]
MANQFVDKIKSKDDRREARIQKRTEEAKEKELFLERPDDLETYQYQLFYLWPSADIPMEQLIDHYGKDVLQELQYTTQSYIEFDASQSLIRVRSSDENAVRHVVLRIGNLLRELIAKVNSSMHVRLVQYPTRGTDTAYINLRPNAFAEIVYPCLEYQCLGDSIDGKPDPRSLQTAFENKKMMSLIVQQCLKNIREPQKHVRMRLQLGMVGLGRRKKMGEASLGYEFDEFIDMLGHSQTEVSLGSIVHGGLTKSQLANIKAIELLDNPTMSYSAEFHLRDDAAAEPTLIIQHEWIENKSGEDLELDGRVWLSKAVVPEERPLEVIVIDFDRTDYQLHIDLASIYSNKNVRKQLEKFENSISFRRYTDAITFAAQPQPQSKFTWSTNNLQRVVDKTMMSFDIRGTTYKFAIMRSDTFTTDPMKTIRSFEQSTFAFYIFDPEWDVSLAEFGHLKAGQDVSWKRDLNTFFPKPWDTQSELTQPTDLNAGFHAFLELVEKVAGQLRHAIDTAE